VRNPFNKCCGKISITETSKSQKCQQNFQNVDVALKMHAIKGSPQGEFSDDGKGEIKKLPIPHHYLDPQRSFQYCNNPSLEVFQVLTKHASIPFFTILQNIDHCPSAI
jgi:hypothetical protein